MPKQFTLRDPEGAACTAGVLAYIALAYLGGWYALWQPDLAVNLLGVLLCTHGMIIASYLLHDCGHNAVFVATEGNAAPGKNPQLDNRQLLWAF
ncbi:MAG: hypothetical protein R3E50_02435 [Halioglobus sp.]